MTAQSTQSILPAGTTPVPLTPAATDTIARSQFGANGVLARVITSGTTTTVVVVDPGVTPGLGNPGVTPGVVCAATGQVMIPVPVAAINPATDTASLTFSGARTGVTYELYRY